MWFSLLAVTCSRSSAPVTLDYYYCYSAGTSQLIPYSSFYPIGSTCKVYCNSADQIIPYEERVGTAYVCQADGTW